MRSYKHWGGLLTAALLGLAILGCPKENTTDNTTPGPAPGPTSGGGGGTKKYKIAVIPKGTQNSFWLAVKAGADAAAAEDGVEIVWQGPAKENDITQQIDVVQTQITNHVDAIVLAAADMQSLIPTAKDAASKGIPVVTVDSGLADKDASVCYIATDNVKGGAAAADKLADLIGKKGNVGLLPFIKNAASSEQRQKGFEDEIKKYPDIHLVSTLWDKSDVNEAVNVTEAMLTANPDIVGIFAANEPGGIGAAQVLKRHKLVGKVKLVAFDASADEQSALQDDTIQALIVQDPYQMGYQGVKTALKAIKKEPIPTKEVDSGLTVVTKDNMNDPKVQKLLHPGQ